jgi:hypothetical protein
MRIVYALVLGKRGATAAFAIAGVSLLLQATPTAGGSWPRGDAWLGGILQLLQFGGHTLVGSLAVGVLRAALCRGDDDSSGAMCQPHACLHFIAMLTAWSGRNKILDITLALKGGAVSCIRVSHGYPLACQLKVNAIWGKAYHAALRRTHRACACSLRVARRRRGFPLEPSSAASNECTQVWTIRRLALGDGGAGLCGVATETPAGYDLSPVGIRSIFPCLPGASARVTAVPMSSREKGSAAEVVRTPSRISVTMSWTSCRRVVSSSLRNQ